MCRRRASIYRELSHGSQFWYFLDPTAGRIQQTHPNDVGLKQGYIKSARHRPPGLVLPLDIWTKLIKYDNDDKENPLGNIDDALASLRCRRLPQTSSDLFRLPLETMWTILEMLDVIDVVALTSTCQDMFRVSCSFVARDIRKSSGDCAGRPLAILGNESTSLPNTFLHNGLAYYSISRPDLIDLGSGGSSSFVSPVVASTNPAKEYLAIARLNTYQPPESLSTATETWLSAIRRTPRKIISSHKRTPSGFVTVVENVSLAHTLLTTLLHRTNQPCAFNDPSGTPYYLRNHTTKSLIRTCSCPTPHITAHSKDPASPTHPLTLTDVFTILTRHSDPAFPRRGCLAPPLDPWTSGPWVTGPWAGHSFDIVSVTRHNREYPGSPVWHDRTSAATTRALWESDRLHGSNRIGVFGKPRRGAYRRTPKRKLKARMEAKREWLEYMDALYESIMGAFEGRDGDVDGLVGWWRGRMEDIMGELSGMKEGKMVKGQWKEKVVRKGIRQSERLRVMAAGSGVRKG